MGASREKKTNWFRKMSNRPSHVYSQHKGEKLESEIISPEDLAKQSEAMRETRRNMEKVTESLRENRSPEDVAARRKALRKRFAS